MAHFGQHNIFHGPNQETHRLTTKRNGLCTDYGQTACSLHVLNPLLPGSSTSHRRVTRPTSTSADDGRSAPTPQGVKDLGVVQVLARAQRLAWDCPRSSEVTKRPGKRPSKPRCFGGGPFLCWVLGGRCCYLSGRASRIQGADGTGERFARMGGRCPSVVAPAVGRFGHRVVGGAPPSGAPPAYALRM